MSTVWQPFNVGRKVSDLSELEGLLIPDPDALQGWVVYVVSVPAPISGSSYYALSLSSGAPLDPVDVRPTLLGGDSRWLRVNILGGLGGPPTVIRPDDSPNEGSSFDAAKADHRHGIETAAPVSIGLINDEGDADSFARSTHVHAHGELPGGSLHALATTFQAGFMSPADKAILDGLTVLYAAPLVFGASSVGNTTTPRFLAPGFTTSVAPTSVLPFRMPATGALRKLRVRHNVPVGGAGGIIQYTLRINGVPTALTVSMLSTASDGSDLVNSVAVNAGDLVGLIVTKPANIMGSPSDILASMEFVA